MMFEEYQAIIEALKNIADAIRRRIVMGSDRGVAQLRRVQRVGSMEIVREGRIQMGVCVMRNMEELAMLQRLPLDVKIAKTKLRIREWVNRFGTDGVFVSFSGGKDSTVLLHIVREMYKDVPAVFCDTGLEFPEIRKFVKTFENVEWIIPKMTFKAVVDTYGYPFPSKEVAEYVEISREYLRNKEAFANRPALKVQAEGEEYKPLGLLKLEGKVKTKSGEKSKFNKERYYFMLDAPFEVSARCCGIMKKAPFKEYCDRTGRKAITAQMASESLLRTNIWLKYGCNLFDARVPKSNPMSFWTEQDVLMYCKEHGIKLAPVYGDIVYEGSDGEYYDSCIIENAKLRTTGMRRTGCMFCGFGCQFEKEGEGRFVQLKELHPKVYDYLMRPQTDGGLGYKDIIDWINENGNFNIEY